MKFDLSEEKRKLVEKLMKDKDLQAFVNANFKLEKEFIRLLKEMFPNRNGIYTGLMITSIIENLVGENLK